MPRTKKETARHLASPKPARDQPEWMNQGFTPRSTRSGASFSPYTIVIPEVDLEDLYSKRLAEQEARQGAGDPEVVVLPGRALPEPDYCSMAPAGVGQVGAASRRFRQAEQPEGFQALASLKVESPGPLSAKDNSKRKKKAKKNEQREAARTLSQAPYVKGVGLERAREAAKRQIRVGVDAAELAHSVPAWIGLQRPSNVPLVGGGVLELDDGASEGQVYSQEDVDRLSKAYGLRYLRWNGRETVPIVDLRHRLLVLLGGQPRGKNWPAVIESATCAIEERAARVRLSREKLNHRRAEASFPALARGISHGGGQTQPGELVVEGENRRVTDELLGHDAFISIVGFTAYLFRLWMPLLFSFYNRTKATYQQRMPNLNWPFAAGVFAACTWNFISTVCRAHVDFANLVWGWCVVTALGRFNADRGGHIILWDLRLIIRVPPGASVLFPSALLLHSNTPIGPGETRSSFVQYSAGGLFRWVEQGFQTQDSFERTATEAEKQSARDRADARWDYGLGHFSIVDDLFSA